MFLIKDTPQFYQKIVKSKYVNNAGTIKNKNEFVKWLDANIYQDSIFRLIKDRKWRDNNPRNLHLLAIYKKSDLRSIRDLRGNHIPLLDYIAEKTLTIIKEKYKLRQKKILVYFHYYPSIWQLHLHFTNIDKEDNAPLELAIGRAHSLMEVMENLEKNKDYYKKATIIVIVNEEKIKNMNIL